MSTKDVVESLGNEALILMARHMAKQMRHPVPGCPGEPEAADTIEVLCDRLADSQPSAQGPAGYIESDEKRQGQS